MAYPSEIICERKKIKYALDTEIGQAEIHECFNEYVWFFTVCEPVYCYFD